MRITSFSQIYHSKPIQYAAISALAIYLFINIRAYWLHRKNRPPALNPLVLATPTHKALRRTSHGSKDAGLKKPPTQPAVILPEETPYPSNILQTPGTFFEDRRRYEAFHARGAGTPDPVTPLYSEGYIRSAKPTESDRKFAEEARSLIQNKLGEQALTHLKKIMTPQIIQIRDGLLQENAFELSEEQLAEDVAEELIKKNTTLSEAVRQASENLMKAAKAEGMGLFGGCRAFTPNPPKRTSEIPYEPRSVQINLVCSVMKRKNDLGDDGALTESILIDALTPIRAQMRPPGSDEDEPWSEE